MSKERHSAIGVVVTLLSLVSAGIAGVSANDPSTQKAGNGIDKFLMVLGRPWGPILDSALGANAEKVSVHMGDFEARLLSKKRVVYRSIVYQIEGQRIVGVEAAVLYYEKPSQLAQMKAISEEIRKLGSVDKAKSTSEKTVIAIRANDVGIVRAAIPKPKLHEFWGIEFDLHGIAGHEPATTEPSTMPVAGRGQKVSRFRLINVAGVPIPLDVRAVRVPELVRTKKMTIGRIDLRDFTTSFGKGKSIRVDCLRYHFLVSDRWLMSLGCNISGKRNTWKTLSEFVAAIRGWGKPIPFKPPDPEMAALRVKMPKTGMGGELLIDWRGLEALARIPAVHWMMTVDLELDEKEIRKLVPTEPDKRENAGTAGQRSPK